MENTRMSYPEVSTAETRKARAQRVALTAAAAREAEHVAQFGKSPVKAARSNGYTMEVRVNGRRRLTMPFEVFKGADYGQLCQYLGLSPSRPDVAANGKRARKPRGRAH